ncbi:protein phosphatases pp1 regulatory subunit, partial [Aphelenchoides avenae]
LTNLVNLHCICVDHSHIRAIENLDNQRDLIDLRLAENRIRRIEKSRTLQSSTLLGACFCSLDSLTAVSQENHVTKLENLDALVDPEELYVAALGVETFVGIQKL